MIRRPPRSTRTDTLSLHDALPISRNIFKPWMLLPMTGGKGINGGLVLQRGTYHVQPFNKHMLMPVGQGKLRSEEHTSELQSLMRISYAVFCLKKNKRILQQISKLYTPQNRHKIQSDQTL